MAPMVNHPVFMVDKEGPVTVERIREIAAAQGNLPTTREVQQIAQQVLYLREKGKRHDN